MLKFCLPHSQSLSASWEFEILQEYPVRHGIFTKQDLGRPPAISDIAQSFQASDAYALQQCHSTTVCDIDRAPGHKRGDGLITTRPFRSLHIYHSDCQAAIFYDKANHVVANIHCGWRGLLGNIYAVTIRKLKQEYQSRPQNLIVTISPSLGTKFAEFKHYQIMFPSIFWPFREQQSLFNLRNIAYQQLTQEGIPSSNIFIASECTYEQHEIFFSYRRSVHQHDAEACSTKPNNITSVMLLERE